MPKSRKMKQIVFVNRFFYPDESATAQILTDLAVYLGKQDYRVDIITSRLSYADPNTRYASFDRLENVNIHRLPTTGFGRAGLIGRAVDYLSFYIASCLAVLKIVGAGSVLVVKTDPPLLSVPVGLAGRLKGAIRINWLQDLFPEVATELDVKLPLLGLVTYLRDRSLRQAKMNIVIGDRMAARVGQLGVAADRIGVIHNFADDVALSISADGAEELRMQWGLSTTDFVIGYSGNLGRAHDFDTVLDAARRLRNHKSIKFLFVGGGHLRREVELQREAHNLTNLIFKPYQPRQALARSLSLPDVHWISLRPEMEGLIVPSKLYGITAVGRGVIMIGDDEGEIGRLIKRHGFGVSVATGAGVALADLVLQLSNDRAKCQKMAAKARHFTEHYGSRQLAFAQWRNHIAQLMETKSAGNS